MLRLFMGLILMLGLAACQDEKKTSHQDVADTSLESSQAAVHSKMDKASPVLNETNAQDVKKNDILPVEISSATTNDSSAVADALATKKEAVTEKMTTATTPVAPAVVKKTVVIEKIAAIETPVAAKEEVVIEKVAASASKGNAEHGKVLTKRCLACHNIGMKDKVGPHLEGVFNRAAGKSGFGRHSAAFKNANWTWDEAHLLKWLCDSKAAVKEFTGDASARTKMPSQKVCGTNGDDMLAYLKTL